MIRAPALPAAVGKASTCATMRAGTVMPLIVVAAVEPTLVWFASSNALVAIAGTAAGARCPAVSVTCPVNGSMTLCPVSSRELHLP
jgi:hypothetical protein